MAHSVTGIHLSTQGEHFVDYPLCYRACQAMITRESKQKERQQGAASTAAAVELATTIVLTRHGARKAVAAQEAEGGPARIARQGPGWVRRRDQSSRQFRDA